MANKISMPLGACRVVWTGVDGEIVTIDETLQDEDTAFVAQTETFKVFSDQKAGAIRAIHLAGEVPASFGCSTFIYPEDLEKLSSAYSTVNGQTLYNPVSKEVKYGSVMIHPIALADDDKSMDIFAEKASCTVSLNGNFKVDGYSRSELMFEFSTPDDNDVVFSIGEATVTV